ncbi:unnamed protein product [Macrosiphum euphorbiae]|uniref:Uncharacterized protein n=1 Tax=Macrosiphum euphorbiae TaxID=13131 RepID=A0AAV0WZ73_9HEMI|nr:unnamed protein product [Macrosiphum euphorbiae]
MKCDNSKNIGTSPDVDNQVTVTEGASPDLSILVRPEDTRGEVLAIQDPATEDNVETVEINSGNDVDLMQEQPISDFWSSTESLDSDDDSSYDGCIDDSCQRKSRSPEVRLPTNAAQFDAAREIVPSSTRRFHRSTIFLDVWKISTLKAEQPDGSVIHLHEFSRTDYKQWLPLPDQPVLPCPPEDDQSWSSDVDRSWLSDEELGPVSVERRAVPEREIKSDGEETWEVYDEALWTSAGDGNLKPPSDHENVDEIVAAADETIEAMPKRRSFLSSLGRRLLNAGRKMFCCGVGRKQSTKL